MTSLLASLLLGVAQITTTDVKAGAGVPAVQGDLVQIEFVATTLAGKTLADSRKRGLCYSVIAGGDDPILSKALLGIKVDGERDFEVDMQAIAKASAHKLNLPQILIKFHVRAVSVIQPKVHEPAQKAP